MTTPDALSQPLFRTAPNYRTLASAIAVFVGGYLVLSSLVGQLAYMVSGLSQNPAEVTVLFVLQAIFAVAVVVLGLLLAAASMGTRLIASGIVVLTVIVTVVSQVTRLTGSAGAAGVPMQMTIGNGYFMTLLGLGAAWLIVRNARLGWLALLAAFVMIPVPYTLILNNIPSVTSQIICQALSLIIGLGILIAGRPLRD